MFLNFRNKKTLNTEYGNINPTKKGIRFKEYLSNSNRISTLSIKKNGKKNNYKGMFPCLRFGVTLILFSSILNAFINFRRVSCGIITSSTKPRWAAV